MSNLSYDLCSAVLDTLQGVRPTVAVHPLQGVMVCCDWTALSAAGHQAQAQLRGQAGLMSPRKFTSHPHASSEHRGSLCNHGQTGSFGSRCDGGVWSLARPAPPSAAHVRRPVLHT